MRTALDALASPDSILGVTEPRIFTPPLRDLYEQNERGEYIASHGFSVIKFAEDLLHLKLFPWQKWLLIHALELTPDGLPRFRIVVVEVARQNGKSIIETVLALWRMYVLAKIENRPCLIIGTAQDLSNSERVWRDALAFIESDDELDELKEDSYFGHPKSLTLTTGSEYRVAATRSAAGRGFPGDLILLDELREHRNWESWSAVTNTMNARPQAQTYAFSNAGTVTSVVLRHLKALAHKELGWPDGDADAELLDDEVVEDNEFELPDGWDDLRLGWFEWSMPPGMARNNPYGLAQSNPSMNHTEVVPNCVTLRALLPAVRSSPAVEVETEICCRWPILGIGGPFPEGSWEESLDADAKPTAEAKRVVCVEVSSRRKQTYISRAAMAEDDVAVVGIWADRAGTDWVVKFLVENKDSIDAIVVRTEVNAPVMSLFDDIQAIGLPVIEWKGLNYNVAHGIIFDRLRDNKIRHLPHDGLDMAATSAVENLKSQGGWTVDIRKSPTDVSPLLATIGAVWGLTQVDSMEYNVLESVW